MSMAAFFAGLNRAGPGDAQSLRWVLATAGTRPDATILDAGCGPGADVATLLAHAPQGRVIAIDHSEAFIARLRADHPSVQTDVGDMRAPIGGPFDLIWSAGAVYTVGIDQALTAWRAHLSPTDPDLAADFRAEIALWQAHKADYGYPILIAEPL